VSEQGLTSPPTQYRLITMEMDHPQCSPPSTPGRDRLQVRLKSQ